MDNLDKDPPRDQHSDSDDPHHSDLIEEGRLNVSADSPPDTDSYKTEPQAVLPPDNKDLAKHLATDQLNSSTMEVHHHGHVHEKKKWKEYVFQFFMLFLAVFCGFLAEYQLEHTIEHNREKQFMASLVKDLETDTAQLNNIKRIRISMTRRIDSALLFLVTHQGSTLPLRQFRNLNLGLRSFYQNSGTLDQLKNAGGLRLIRKRQIVDSISAYDQQIKRMVLRDKFETDKIYDYTTLSEKTFDGQMLAKIYVDTSFLQKIPPSLETPIAMKTEFLGELLSSLITCRASYQSNLLLQDAIKGRAERLIALIKKDYSLQ